MAKVHIVTEIRLSIGIVHYRFIYKFQSIDEYWLVTPHKFLLYISRETQNSTFVTSIVKWTV